MNPLTVHRLLDSGEAARLLALVPGTESVREVALESVWAKPGRYFNVCYRVHSGAADGLASLCIMDHGEAVRAAQRLQQRSAGSTVTAAAVVADDVLAQVFPFDYRLAHLGYCMDPAVVAAALDDTSIDRCEMVAYRAGMRCQFRYSAGESVRAYGKIAVERDPGRRRRVHRELCAATAGHALRVPPLLATVETIGLDVVEAVPGRSLYEVLVQGPNAADAGRAAGALANLHDSAPPLRDRIHSTRDELALVGSWTEWMSGVEPRMDNTLRAALASLASSEPATTPTTFAHRDFYDRQILLQGSGLWLLDIDTACTGDRELDLGNFLAHLFLRGLQWNRVAAHRELETAAQMAYGGRADHDVTRWYRRASLLRLACVYQLRPRWRHIVTSLFDEAVLP